MISRALIVLGALAVLGFAAALVLGADQFPGPGRPAEPRLVVLLVAATLGASVLHVLACLAAYRRPPRLVLILAVGFAARLLLLFAAPQPVLEGDPQRVRFEGRLVNRGVHPYEFKPSHLADAAPQDVLLTASQHDRLVRARAALSASTDAARPEELRRPDLRTTSTPTVHWLSALADRFKRSSTRGYAFFILVADVLAVYLLLLALRAMGLPLSWVIVYAWSPILLKEAYCTLAVDAFVLPCLAGLIFCIAKGWRVLGAIPLALAGAVRLPLLLLVPVTARRIGFLGVVLAVLLLTLPYLSFHNPEVPAANYVEGPLHVWRHYEYNSLSENILRGTLRFLPTQAENSLVIAGVEIIRPQQKIDALLAKLGCALLLLGLLTYLVIRIPSPHELPGAETRRGHTDLFAAVAAILLLGPVLEPAHTLWLLPILVVRPGGVAWLLLPGLVSLSYLTHIEGPSAADFTILDGRMSFRAIEYGAFGFLLLLDLVWRGVLFRNWDRIQIAVPTAQESEDPAFLDAEEPVSTFSL